MAVSVSLRLALVCRWLVDDIRFRFQVSCPQGSTDGIRECEDEPNYRNETEYKRADAKTDIRRSVEGLLDMRIIHARSVLSPVLVHEGSPLTVIKTFELEIASVPSRTGTVTIDAHKRDGSNDRYDVQWESKEVPKDAVPG